MRPRAGVALSLFLTAAVMEPGSEADAQQVDVSGVVRDLQPAIREVLRDGSVPGMSMALVVDSNVVWSGAYGVSNRWTGALARDSTVYVIGSTFKAMAAAALLQLRDQGLFALDDPIHDYLGEIVIRGEDPKKPVTFRHLLTHVSGMGNARGAYPVWGLTVPPPLDVFLADSLRLEVATGTQLLYSNMAFTVVGYLVERLSGRPFREYVRDRIWRPLGMLDTDFAPTPRMDERLAVPYVSDPLTGRLEPAVRTKAVDYPAGVVYGTACDLARWLAANLNDGMFQGTRILSASSLREMHRRQSDDPRFLGPRSAGWGDEETGYGLSWWVSGRDGNQVIAHSGSMSGWTAFVAGDLDRRVGLVLLTNGDQAHRRLFDLAERTLDLLAGLGRGHEGLGNPLERKTPE